MFQNVNETGGGTPPELLSEGPTAAPPQTIAPAQSGRGAPAQLLQKARVKTPVIISMHEQDNVAIRLLVLYVASWSYALGIVGVVSSLVWWLVEWRGGQATQTALKPYFHAEPRRRYFEEPEGPQFLPPDVALVPSRLSRRRK